MAKKYFIEVIGEAGQVVFKSQSDSAKALLKRYNKAAYGQDGMYKDFFFGTKSTNITEEIEYRVSCGWDI